MPLTIAIDYRDRRILITKVFFLLAFLRIFSSQNMTVFYGIRNARNCQHGLCLTSYLPINLAYQPFYNKIGNLLHSWLKGVYPVFILVYLDVILSLQVWWQLELHRHDIRYNMLSRVKNIPISYGFFHAIAIKRHPHGYGAGTSELTKAC